MEGIICYQCKKETRKFADIFSCSHSICPKCLSRSLLDDNFEAVNNIYFEKNNANFKYTCLCQKGTSKSNFNFYCNVVNELIKKKIPGNCFKHSNIIGTIFCPYCDVWSCDDCFKDSECSNHLNPGELTSKCQNHNFNNLNSYCDDCKTTICKECKEIDHHSHNTRYFSKDDKKKKLRSLPFKNYEDVKQKIDFLYNKAYENYKKILDNQVKFFDSLIDKIEAHKFEYQREMNSKMNKIKQIVDVIKITYENLYLDTEFDLEQLLNIKKYMNNFLYNISISAELDPDMTYINSKINLYIPGSVTFDYSFQFKKTKVKCNLTSSMTSKIKAMAVVGKFTIAFGTSNFIQLYNCKTKNWTDFETLSHKDDVTCILKLENDTLASGSADKTIKIWDLNTLKEVSTLEGHKKEVTSLCLVKPGFIASSGCDGRIKIWNYLELKDQMTIISDDNLPIFTVIILANGALASGGESETIKIWDYQSIGEECTLYGHLNNVTQLIELKDKQLASSSMDKTIKIWRNKACELTLNGHVNGVLCIFQLTDSRLVSGSADKTVRIWNLISGTSDCILSGHNDNITSIVQLDWFKPNKRKDYLIITSSFDNSFKIWK